MSKIRLLVTGASGFIGSHLVELLLKKKLKVKAFVKYSSSSDINWLKNIDSLKNKNLKIIYGDIRDYDSINNALDKCDAVINLAAMISVPYSFKNPQSFVDTNVYGALNLFRACKNRKKKIKKIIQISSSEVYGNILRSGKKILKESDILNAESPYAASKIAADHLSLTMFKEHDLPITIARPFNTFGPRQSLRAVIPTIITQIIKSDKIIVGNVKTSRDFLYVKDNVKALYNILNTKKTEGKVYNIATQHSTEISKVIEILKDNTKKKLIIKKNKNRFRKSEVYKLLGSNRKIIKDTNWRPEFSGSSGFKKALIETYNWFLDPNNISLYKDISKYHI